MPWWRRRSQRDFNDEVQAHLDLEAERLIGQGLEAAEALAAARKTFGNVTSAEERFFESHRWLWADRAGHHLCHAARTLWANRGVSVACIVTLGFGIGVNTAAFSTVYGILFRPLPVHEPERVVNVYQEFRGRFGREVAGNIALLSYAEYRRYAATSRTLESLAAYAEEEFAVAGDERIVTRGALVSCNYFQTLGVPLARGRAFSPGECAQSGGDPVAIVSYAFWQRQLGGDSTILGRTVVVNRVPLSIIGVAQRGFGGLSWFPEQLWVPVTMEGVLSHGRDSSLVRANKSWLVSVGRLRATATREQVRAELSVVARQADADYPGRETQVIVNPGTFGSLPEVQKGGVLFGALIGGLGFLIIAMVSANVMNLLLARAMVRRREIAIRLAMGATRSRLVEQLVIESLLLGILGGGLGLALASWLPRVINRAAGAPSQLAFSPDSRVFLYGLVVSILTALLAGLVPAFAATDLSLAPALKDGPGTLDRRGRRVGLRDVMVGVQVAGSAALLVVAGLFLRGLGQAYTVDPGFATNGVLAIRLDVAALGYEPAKARAVFDQLRDRIGNVPGVEAQALVWNLPQRVRSTLLIGTGPGGTVVGDPLPTDVNYVSGRYFDVMGIPIIRGRSWRDEENRDEATTAVVSDAMAKRSWPGQDPIGRPIGEGGTTYVVVGVAKDIHNLEMGRLDGPFVYLANGPENAGGMTIVARAPEATASLERVVPELVRQIDPNVKVATLRIEEHMRSVLRPNQTIAAVLGLLGALALGLAMIGVYGVVSYGARQRTREIGVRIALGATRRDVIALVMRQGSRAVGAGVLSGLLLAAGISQVFRSMLFGVSALDPVAYAGIAGLLVVVAFAASYLPARRAAALDPVRTLRED